ncbi:MAG TPA: DUF1641 domain-containing protein [Candidatus Binatia bacterium]|nr:DUF1641 domain-containing protein [Candidatus Binatia bacterium]
MRADVTEATIEERLAGLAAQLDGIKAELDQQRLERERWRELGDDMAPLAEEAMTLAIGHLDADGCDFSDLASLAHAVVRDAATIQAWIAPLRTLAALADEVGPLTTPAMASLNRRLEQLDERGYFSFARQAAGVVDTVVTAFTEEDVRLLGENIVLILQTVKQMTQPEVMNLLGRTARSLQDGDTDTVVATPSSLSLLRQLRDPMVRRGLARVLATLRAVGAEAAPPHHS